MIITITYEGPEKALLIARDHRNGHAALVRREIPLEVPGELDSKVFYQHADDIRLEMENKFAARAAL